ncbi:hypothetical protein JJB07_16835 [Tumebacillus sp. ITR2]|uniref:Uncharacterized protein n=1 Tax=Tumebacillus amylolyticus TaxID=2801339 RepID=A0ABS1JDB2_9BACL|nr:hypothetical protein [Tumebacillus amylolyticus]MBL0388277.1 hypothetical protein [Tumebacillus amylolyticus]
MQINLNFLKVSTFDKSFMSIGPSIQNVVRAKANQNYGLGEILGDDNEIFGAKYEVIDNDVYDFPIKKVTISK